MSNASGRLEKLRRHSTPTPRPISRPVDPRNGTPGPPQNGRGRWGHARLASGSPSGADRPALSVRDALRHLPDQKDRAIVLMRFFIGLSLTQISYRLGMDLLEVAGRYRSSVRQIRRILLAA